jgi:DNA-binding IclR family transcriptional regulator
VARLIERRLLVGPYDEHSLESYVAELGQVAEQGFAINDGRTSVEEVGVAAPVRDHRGVVVAAVLLSAPRFRVPPAMLDVLARSVRETATEVTARLGGGTPP